jgi:hypothetical protein
MQLSELRPGQKFKYEKSTTTWMCVSLHLIDERYCDYTIAAVCLTTGNIELFYDDFQIEVQK